MRNKKPSSKSNTNDSTDTPPVAKQQSKSSNEFTDLQDVLAQIILYLQVNKIITVACDKGGTSAKSFFLINYSLF